MKSSTRHHLGLCISNFSFSVDSFEVVSLDGANSAMLQFEDGRTCDDWMHCFQYNIVAQNNLSVCYPLTTCLLKTIDSISFFTPGRTDPSRHARKTRRRYMNPH